MHHTLQSGIVQTQGEGTTLPQPVSSTTPASPHSTIRAHENVFRQMMIADLTLQAPCVPPSPLGVPMMLAAHVLVMQ
jgi:hypothetical protein